MASTLNPQLETFAAGAETAVDVAQIERQLRDLWQLAAESQKDEARRRITRACLFNLVVYCESEADRDHSSGIISEVTSRHPCRAIVLLAQPGATTNEIGAFITAHCHLAGGGGKQVCCEQISIHASGTSVTDLPGAALPLLESDLPTKLWWHGNFLERLELFHRLSAVSDQIVFDSSAWRPTPSWLVLEHEIAGNPRLYFADLSWTRLALWQQSLAEAFDEPRCVAALPRLERIEIVHGCAPGTRPRAQLLAGWLAAQLGWRATVAQTRIHLRSQPDTDATAVGLISVTLKSRDIEVCVRKNLGEQTASVTVNMADACGLPRKRVLWPTDDAALLCQELDHTAPHKVYRAALKMVAELNA